MPPDTGEKTEDPTPRRRQEARDEGNVARSQDLTAAISLLGAVVLLGWFGQNVFGGFRWLVRSMLGGELSRDMTLAGDVSQITVLGMKVAAEVLAPIAVGVVLLGVAANVVQIGFLISLKPVTPSFNKLSPIRGLQNLFSRRALMRLVMSLGKVGIVVAVAGFSIYWDFERILALIHLEAGALLAAAAGLAWNLALRIAIVLLIIAWIDFIYQKWQHEQDLKMTKEEVKEEMKRMEGDPLVKQRRAKVARQLAMQRISAAVPGADVVVTNPTHYAVALKYDETMAAPKVVAKGADYMAMRIRQLAIAHEVPIVERPPLARALYRGVEVGQQIPADFYAAVAEILAYVYRLNQRQPA